MVERLLDSMTLGRKAQRLADAYYPARTGGMHQSRSRCGGHIPDALGGSRARIGRCSVHSGI
jgi:hypothetical protein